MITENIQNVYKNTINVAKNMKGYIRRTFIASFIKDKNISINMASSIFDISRQCIKKGTIELELGKEIKPDSETRGGKSVDKKFPDLADDINNIVKDWSQTDPKFKMEKKVC